MTITFPALTEAQAALDASRKQLADVFAEAGPNFDMTQVKSLTGDTSDKLDWIRKKNTEMEERKAKVTELQEVGRIAHNHVQGGGDGGGAGSVEPGAEPGAPAKGGRRGERKSLGRLFVESDACRNYRSGNGPAKAHLDVELKALFERDSGWDPEVTRTGRLEDFATRPAPHVADFFPPTTTVQAAIKYMEETTFTNTAAERAEGTAYPEAALELTERTRPVEKVAVWLPVTDEQFEDEARAEGYVNNRLPFMLQQRLDSQLLVGNGTAPNLLGTENVSGIQTQAKGGDSDPDAIYKAMRKIRDDGFAEPNVVFLTPANWEPVRLLKTADGQYIWGHPALPGPDTIWGVPVVQTTAAPATKALLGDYRNFAELAVRRGIDVQTTNSHGEFFIAGKLAIRADVRVAAIHYRPKAFAEVTGLGA